MISIFCTQVQNEKRIKNYESRSDHGGEFENEQFEKICEKHGLIHAFSCPITPEQNGVVETKNRSLQKKMARRMIYETNIVMYFRAEVVNTSCYVHNKIYIRPILKKTSYESTKEEDQL